MSSTNPIGRSGSEQFYRGTLPSARQPERPPKLEFTQPWPHGAADIPGNQPETCCTDLGNAKRLVIGWGEDIRYCHATKKWFFWSDKHWVVDQAGMVLRLAKSAVRAILQEAAFAPNDAERKALVSHEQKSEGEGRLRAMVSLAQSEPGIPIQLRDLDSDPMLLNVGNGTLDLATGALLPHDRKDLITKIVPVDYDPKAACPTWNAFVARIFPDPLLIEFVRRALGYTLMGTALEHVLFLLHGLGANGKSTFLEVVRFILGDYAATADFGTFLAQKGLPIRNDIARLRGARFVTAIESGAGKRLDENVVKAVTGQDTIAARFLYSEHFEFIPAFKLWLATNHKPRILGTDESVWRRIKLIPFKVTIPSDQRDRGLVAKLKAEGSGILNEFVRGFQDYQLVGLGESQAVTEATRDYRQDQDVLGHFIEAKLEIDPAAETRSSDVYAAYKKWTEETGEYSLNERDFVNAMLERGFTSKRISKRSDRPGGVYWRGIHVEF